MRPDWFPAVVGNLIAYCDGEHLTPALSATLAPVLAPTLTSVRRRDA